MQNSKTANDMRIECQIHLSGAYSVLRDESKAENCIRAAYALDHINLNVVGRMAAIFANEGDYDKAIEIITPLLNESCSLGLVDVYARILLYRKSEGDRRRALHILCQYICDLDKYLPEFRYQFVEQLTLLSKEVESAEIALERLNGIGSEILNEAAKEIIKAKIYGICQNKNSFYSTANNLLQVKQNLDWFEKRKLAELFESSNDWGTALELWKDVVSNHSISNDTFNFLKCAEKAEDISAIIYLCESLRKNGIWDERIIHTELDWREKNNDYENAINVLNEAIEKLQNVESKKTFRLRRSILGINLKRNDLLETDVKLLPDVNMIKAEAGCLVTNMLRIAQKFEAIFYAYDLWRKFSDDEYVNFCYISLFLPIGPKLDICEVYTVQSGTAVLYEDIDLKEQVWHIIEDSDICQLESSRNEYNSSHPISQKLIGKKVGDTFEIVKDSLEERTGKIIEIVSKYIYRLRRILEEFPKKFPGSNLIRRFAGFKDDGNINYEPFVRLLKHDNENADKSIEIYNDNYLPIYCLCRQKSCSEMIVMNYLASSDHLKIKTCFGNEEEWQYCNSLINTKTPIVLDKTAVVTLLLLYGPDYFQFDHDLYISEGVFNEITSFEIFDDRYVDNNGYLFLKDDKLGLIENNKEILKTEKNKAIDFLDWFKLQVKIVSGIEAVSLIPAEKRNQIKKLVGQSNMETLALASQKDYLLWTDDQTLSILGTNELRCKRIWTQPMLMYCCESSRISDLNLKLYQWGYVFTKLHINDVKKAIEQSSWDVNKPPLKYVINIFSDDNIVLGCIAGMFYEVIQYIWHVTTDYTAQNLTIALFNELSKRPGGIALIEALPINTMFRFDPITQNKVRNIINIWKLSGHLFL